MAAIGTAATTYYFKSIKSYTPTRQNILCICIPLPL